MKPRLESAAYCLRHTLNFENFGRILKPVLIGMQRFFREPEKPHATDERALNAETHPI